MTLRFLKLSTVVLGFAGLMVTAGCGHRGDAGAPKTPAQAQSYGQRHAQDMGRFMQQRAQQGGGPH